MPHRPPPPDRLRQEIAEAAALLIAEGQTDYHAAKLKAARTLGASPREALPDNAEVEAALRTHYALFDDGQREALAALRAEALDIMESLAEFAPWLSGPVLTGTANEFTPISLEIIGADIKAFDMWLINAGVEYECRPYRGNTQAFSYQLDHDGIAVDITLFDSHAERARAFPTSHIHHEHMQWRDAQERFRAG